MKNPCSHVWIDPEEASCLPVTYSPVVGPGRHEMKAGKTYVCKNCALHVKAPAADAPVVKEASFRATSASEAPLPMLPCECGCGKFCPGGMMEAAHPEDYRSER